MNAENGERGIRRYIPILAWLPQYQRAWLRLDFIAGLTIMALLVPEGMAYAELAGLPPQTVFYAAPIGLVLFAIFGTSRQLVIVVSSAVAVMSASIVGGLIPAGSTEFIVMTAALAILAGIVAVLAGLLRLGRDRPVFLRIGFDGLCVRAGAGHHDQAGAQIVWSGTGRWEIFGNGLSSWFVNFQRRT